MKKQLLFVIVLFSGHFLFAQDNGLAVQAYKDAEDAFNAKNYETALSNLNIAEAMLKGSNPKIQGLKLKTFKQMAFEDSVKNYSAYSSYVNELKVKKSSIAKEASDGLAVFPKEKSEFILSRRNSLVLPIENITVGQLFSSIDQNAHPILDFNKPKDELSVLRYVRKNGIPDTDLGLLEMVVDKNTGRIIRLSNVIKSLSNSELLQMKIVKYYEEKLNRFGLTNSASENKITKITKTEYNHNSTIVKIDDSATYFLDFYAPVKLDMKSVKNGSPMYIFAEGYELK
jgi:hypothetical protein